MSKEIKVMSFNLRMDTEHDGINRFRNRIDRVMANHHFWPAGL